MVLKDYDEWGRRFCPFCDEMVITKKGVSNSLWCNQCNGPVEDEE